LQKVFIVIFAFLLLGSTITNSTFAVDSSLNFGGRGTDAGQMDEPRGITVDSEGMIYVADTRNDRVQKFDENGVFVEILDFGAEMPSDPSDVSVEVSHLLATAGELMQDSWMSQGG
jgi:DNA-binding beta-propeller fold protein YncE